jgi:hypothetical protein
MFSLNLITVLLNLGLQAPADAPYQILSECDGSSAVRAQVSRDTPLEIRYSIAGAPTCYSVTATVDGREIKGYVLDATLEAVQGFEKARADAEREAFKLSPAPPPLLPAPKPAAAASDSTSAASAGNDAANREKTTPVPPNRDKESPPPAKTARKPMSL